MPTVTKQQEGERVWFGGGLVTFKVTTEQSGGEICLIEHAASRGKATPLHRHPDHDETGYVLEGELLCHINGIEQTAGPGDVVWIPPGVKHWHVAMPTEPFTLLALSFGATNCIEKVRYQHYSGK